MVVHPGFHNKNLLTFLNGEPTNLLIGLSIGTLA
jgi:hypothetical protein